MQETERKGKAEDRKDQSQDNQLETNFLSDSLIRYQMSDMYPFHMPGHKRNMKKYPFHDSYAIDITEIDGFDNLHMARGIIKRAEERAASLYGSDETHFLVNGSTCGILSAILGSVKKNGKILMAANSHKAAFHALLLKDCRCELIYPEINVEYDIVGGINPLHVEALLQKNPDTQAVFITSPTYEGMISPVREIAKIVHSYGSILIVDEAHGAHFGLYEPYKKKYGMCSSVQESADVVIHSVHKTLPSYTQTALIHLNGSLVDREKVRSYLKIFQTSSPSYVLMNGIDRCIGILETEGQDLFQRWDKNITEFNKLREELKYIRFLGDEVIGSSKIEGRDVGKFLFSVKNTTIGGVRIYDILREKYHLQLEMAAGNYCLAISTIMDTKEGFLRLRKAFLEIDSILEETEISDVEIQFLRLKKIYEIYEVQDLKSERITFIDCKGRIAADFIYVYPPGIPLIVPGEEVSDNFISSIRSMEKQGLNVVGIEEGKFKVLER